MCGGHIILYSRFSANCLGYFRHLPNTYRVTTMYWYATLWLSGDLDELILSIFLMNNKFYVYWASVQPKKNVSRLHTASVLCHNIIIVNSLERPFWHTQKIGFNPSIFLIKSYPILFKRKYVLKKYHFWMVRRFHKLSIAGFSAI